MALRILTGVIRPQAGHLTKGQAKISFDPHMVGGEATGMDLEETGAAGSFISRPGKVVALRDFVAQDRRSHMEDASARDRFRIDDHVWDADRFSS